MIDGFFLTLQSLFIQLLDVKNNYENIVNIDGYFFK